MNVPLVVRIPKQQKNLIRLEAQRQRRTVSDVVRHAITIYFSEQSFTDKSLFQELAAIGEKAKHKHSPKDLSTNYKRYLYDSN